MASVIAEADLWNATVTAPDDGDTRSAASVTAAGVGFQVLTDRALWLRNRVSPAAGHTIVLPFTPTDNTAHNWGHSAGSSNWSSAVANIRFDIPLPSTIGSDFVSFTLRYFPQAGAFAAATPLLAQLSLFSVNLVTGARSTIGTVTDPAVAAGGYDLIHDLTLTLGAPHTYDPATEMMWLAYQNDNGGTNTILYGFRAAMQTT